MGVSDLLAFAIVIVLVIIAIFMYFKMEDNKRQEAELLHSMQLLQNQERQDSEAAKARYLSVYPLSYYPDYNWWPRRRLYGGWGGRRWHRR